MRIIVQKAPSFHAFLMDDTDRVIVSESGPNELEAVGRLVTIHHLRFGLAGVTRKHGEPVETD